RQAGRVVRATCYDGLGVAAESDRGDVIVVAQGFTDGLTIARLPHTRRLILTAGQQEQTVRAKRHASDRSAMPHGADVFWLQFGEVPDERVLVGAGRSDSLAVP